MSDVPERWTQARVDPDMWTDPDQDPRKSDGVSRDGEKKAIGEMRSDGRAARGVPGGRPPGLAPKSRNGSKHGL
jgi:hypothetical protein